MIGEATPVAVVYPTDPADSEAFVVNTVWGEERREGERSEGEYRRQKKLKEVLSEPDFPDQEKRVLMEFLTVNHHIFSLEEGERGETDLVQMEIDTGDAHPKKQPPRRKPFALRREVARQLSEMQSKGVIEPSRSPWASPVVLVKKRDDTHRFCIDYRGLNSVTKPDGFPLPRIEYLLDQLGGCKYFSTIDLASGFWQIRMHPKAQEKTAFAIHQGLFEFRVMPFGLTNAPAVFQRLMQQVVTPLNPKSGPDFVSVYVDDILVFSASLEEHLSHLKIVIHRLAEAGLKLKPSKCRFAQKELQFLGHIISRDGLKTNPGLVRAVSDFPVPRTVHDAQRFIGLASYYRKFIPKFSRIARPLHQLTCKGAHFAWSIECSEAFEELKWRLTTAPVLAYPDFQREFVLENDASIEGIGAVLGQSLEDKKIHPVAYASRALSKAEKHYSITELETLAVVWAVSHFHHHLYGNVVTVFTDHMAVKAVLETPNPTGKHARWWSRVYGRGVKKVHIVYRAGKENLNADALSRCPQLPAPAVGLAQDEVQISALNSTEGDPDVASQEEVASCSGAHGEVDCEAEDLCLSELLHTSEERADGLQSHAVDDSQVPSLGIANQSLESFSSEQRNDPEVKELIVFLEDGTLPTDDVKARKLALQESLFTVTDGILYFLDPKHGNRKRAVVPKQLRRQILQEVHSSPFGSHFSGQRLYNSLVVRWWWGGMFNDAVRVARACPECAVALGTGRKTKPPLQPIPVARPFQILGIDVMDLPMTERGNKHVVVIQDLFTKWPFVFAVPDQKTTRIARLLAEEVIPWFGVPESLLSDRGTNLLSNLMVDLCKMLGVTKLNTTAYHPQCDGAVERFNRTLKTALRKHAARFGCQWDQFLPGILWAYRNTPHSSTGEKPSFLLYGVDCRSPTDAAYLPVSSIHPTDITDYREELMCSLSSAREIAATSIRRAQARYKRQYDRRARESTVRIGDWVLIRFPQDESGRWRKLSWPWHGPYRVVDRSDPDVTCVKIYYPQDGEIRVHQSRVCDCPAEFLAGYYWYGGRRRGPGCPPKWVERLMQPTEDPVDEDHGDLIQGAEGRDDPDLRNEPDSSTNPSQSVDTKLRDDRECREGGRNERETQQPDMRAPSPDYPSQPNRLTPSPLERKRDDKETQERRFDKQETRGKEHSRCLRERVKPPERLM